MSAMLANVSWDDKDKILSATVNPFFYEAYLAGTVTLMDVAKRMSLSGTIARSLYRFVQSHRDNPVFSGHFLTLAQVLNMDTEQPGRKLRELLKKANSELIKNGILTKKSKFISQDIIQLLNESRDGLERVRKIVGDLRSFSRVGQIDWQWADLHKGIDSTLNIVWNELKYKCTVAKKYADLPEVYCLPSQLNQVFMNLLVNAAQAIEERGNITIRTGRQGDKEVWVEVADTGKGIPAENLNRVFEPFFTTKPVGQGTGLGLSLSYGIAVKHQGRIAVASEVGKGSTFRVTIPIHPDLENPAASPN